MTLNRAKLGRVVTFLKYLATIVSLVVLRKTLIWNKITFPASNLLSFSELVENDLLKKSLMENFIFCAVAVVTKSEQANLQSTLNKRARGASLKIFVTDSR